jgi:DNA segregation ATPase FtsK/SpoIIIE-like protein
MLLIYIGLGFRGKISEEKEKDALQKRLDKNNKKKKNNLDDEKTETKDADNDNDDDLGQQLHGVVENMPISRTQLKRSNPVTSSTKTQPKKLATIEIIKEDLGLSLPTPPVFTAPLTKEAKIFSNPDKQKGFFNDGYKKGDANNFKNEDGEVRKRTKTRSKQKNIRCVYIHIYGYMYKHLELQFDIYLSLSNKVQKQLLNTRKFWTPS